MKHPVARSFEDLIVWQKAHQFVLMVYQLTKTFPAEELYGLIS
ncbi:MAG: four helix bundle protein, partial [Ignavibacteriales bacterium]|nr:four helix bundle protein [Ignavibacteriales bacterium]